MPEWDQWDAEGLNLFAPWFENDHFVAHLLEPHNEHRVLLTKLQNLVVTLVNGQWDSRVECLFNAFLHGLIALALWRLARSLRPVWQACTYVTVLALYALPLAWQNLLGGFHSQQYWLIGLSMATLLLLPFAAAWSPRWWLGVAASLLAVGSMGSGFLVAPVVIGLVWWRWWQRRTNARDAWPTFVVMASLIAVGLATRVEVAYHQQLKAKTVHDFVFSLLRSLEWPLREHDWAGAVVWCPWVIIAVLLLRRTGPRWSPTSPTGFRPAPLSQPDGDIGLHRSKAGLGAMADPSLVILGLGGWVLVQLVATAYARGAGADYPASRYMDTLIFATAVNALALGWLLTQASDARSAGLNSEVGAVLSARIAGDGGKQRGEGTRPTFRFALYVIGLAWLSVVSLGTYQLYRRNVMEELPGTKNYYIHAEKHLRAYLATGDAEELADPIPYPSVESFLERLRHPILRELMPQSVRRPLSLSAAPAHQPDPFLHNQARQRSLETAKRDGFSPATPALGAHLTWGSYTSAGAAYMGEWRSLPIVAPLGAWLKFETAGQLGEPGVGLELRDAGTDAVVGTVRPGKVPGNTWRSAYVRAPGAPFVVVASDRDPTRWLAFSAPVEMGRLSHLAWQAMKHSRLMVEIVAAIIILLGATMLFFNPRGSPETTGDAVGAPPPAH